MGFRMKTPEFYTWVLKTHPALFEDWELEASEWVDLDEWLKREAAHVIEEWNTFCRTKPGGW